MIGLRDGAKWRVLEGNRRLAAIRILQNPPLAHGTGITVPAITKRNLGTLDMASIYAVASREDAREFIGFKHINGPHKWDALAKARFAADWYRKEKGAGLTIDRIAHRLGDNHDTVARLVSGIFVLDQARAHGIFDIADRYTKKFAFSHLYIALTRPGYRSFLGLPDDWRGDEPKENPISKAHSDDLRLVLTWLYGSKADNTKPVINSQNPDIKNLGSVLGNSRARAIMMSRNNLAEAYASVEPKGTRFETALINARQEAERALSVVTGFDPEDSTLLEIGKDLSETSSQVYITMSAMAAKKSPAKGRK
jgi:hypothetical protein